MTVAAGHSAAGSRRNADGDDPGIERRRLHVIVASAFTVLDELDVARPGSADVPARPVPDPVSAPWLQVGDGAARIAVFDRMIEDAVAFAAVAGAAGDAERLLA